MRAVHPRRTLTDPQARLRLTTHEPERPRQQCKVRTRTGVPGHRRFRKTAIPPTVSIRQMPTEPPGKFTLLTVAQLTVHRERTATAHLWPKQRMAISTRPRMETPTRIPEVAGREIRTILRNTTRAKLLGQSSAAAKGWGGQEKSSGSSAWGGGGGGGWQSRSESARGAPKYGRRRRLGRPRRRRRRWTAQVNATAKLVRSRSLGTI